MKKVFAAAALLPLGFSAVAVAQHQQPAPIERHAPAPIERRFPGGHPNGGQGFSHGNGGGGQLRGQHLTEWMNSHSNLTPQQKQEALSREPGFRDLPSETQQHIRDRLSQLEAMSPDQRQRMMSHAEQMERLDPNQRADVRSAMLQLSALPPDQRRMVSHEFRELRSVPIAQRNEILLGGRLNYLNQQQRVTLDHLMAIEPLLPPQGR
ncbi:MAG: DUF3106 domain-containing protein [Acidobacteriaceae bacterium]|nr:DUF3106 domain-containing protein [Acidobacteriaceae bacterium]